MGIEFAREHQLSQFAFQCDLAVEFCLANGIAGTRRDGVWTGDVKKRWHLGGTHCRWRKDAVGNIVHSWIETPDGLVIDPTRWVLEGVWPYLYRGQLDYYTDAVEPLETGV